MCHLVTKMIQIWWERCQIILEITLVYQVSVSGTTLKLVAKEGYTDGIDDTVTLTDANFTPENIRGDKIVFGLAGTAAQGPLSRALLGVVGKIFLHRL